MNWIRRNYVATIIIWLFLTVISVVMLPDISALIRQKGQVTLPSTSESFQAHKLNKEMQTGKNSSSVVIVYHKESKINQKDQRKINDRVKQLVRQKNNYQVTKITSALNGKDVAKQVISRNQQTELVNVDVEKTANFDHQAQRIKRLLKVEGLQTYVTSDALLADEFSNTTEEGIKKTEVIAIIFIFIVLVLVFRSLIIPLVSLLNVGIAMIISLSLVMNLAKYFNFPISDFTQVFLVIILFGIGTDYNILLYDKFKEELANSNQYQAIKVVKASAGRTILYSGLSVFIGFASLSFAKFSFYRSAVSCSVGVLVLLAVLLTLNYFFMAVLGRKLFWPSHNFKIQQSSQFWQFLSQRGLKQPLIYIVIFGVIAGITIVNAPQQLNFNSADEVPNNNPIKKGYLIAQRDFSKGKISPTTINIKLNHPLNNQQDLAAIDQITNAVKKNSGVKSVMSVTQPTGKPLNQLYVKNQLKTVLTGLQQSQTGLTTIKNGLQNARNQLASANVKEQLAQVQQLADGSQRLADASGQFNTGLNQYLAGTNQLASGIGQLQVGINPFASGINQVTSASQKLNQSVTEANQQIQQLSSLMTSHSNGSYFAIASQLNQGTSQLAGALTTINQQVPTLSQGINQLTSGSSELIRTGNQLKTAGTQLASGGQQLNGGINQVNGGVQQLNHQLQAMSSQLSQLEAGLNQAVGGLDKVQNGINEVQLYLGELRNSPAGNQLNIPQNKLNNSDLVTSYNTYMNKNRQLTQLSVVLKANPNSHAAAKTVKQLEKDVKAQIKATSLSKAKLAIGGQTSQNLDLETLSQGDFTRTAMIMIIGIGITLLFFTRSVLQPMVIIATLVGTYYTAINLTTLIAQHLLHEQMLTWNAPFFTFIMLVALGVDYSIFLMMRY
ncbi:MAG: MMPL family transporter [Lactobacillus sp.]|nr:MMPL family transporter [Lactobacillus sp.]